jgi:MFS family permease
MSFKLFIYYCALCGGWAAFMTWGLIFALKLDDRIENLYLKAAAIAAMLGLFVAFAIGILDALMNSTGFQRFARVLVCVGVGLIGGLLGGLFGEILFSASHFFRPVGWALAGSIIGASIGVFDLLRASMSSSGGVGMALRKMINGVIGGSIGGFIGGILLDIMGKTSGALGINLEQSPRMIGLVILGACIGLLIALAQVILKEASILVEAGFKAGRNIILSKPETTAGRAEGNDIGLFGDQGVEKHHAKIVKKGDRYVLVDNGTPGGTYLNGMRIDGPAPLRSGDAIGMGRSVLRFTERQKRSR